MPGFFCQQERIRDDLLNGAQVMAVFAYNVAQLDELLPRPGAPATVTGRTLAG